MTGIKGEYKTKNSGGKGEDYLIECTQNVCVIKYKGEIKYRRPFKWVPLVNTFGENAIQFFGILEIILGIIVTLIVFISIISPNEIETKGVQGFLLVVVIFFVSLFISLGLISEGISLLSSTRFLKVRCKRCGRKKAYEEREKPDVREDSTESLYAVTITRYWKCKYCGYLDRTESSENIKCFKVKKKRPIEITCEKCGKASLSSECRNPDMKSENFFVGSSSTEIRYYKCNYCGHLNIEVKKTNLNYGEPLASSEIKGKDPRL